MINPHFDDDDDLLDESSGLVAIEQAWDEVFGQMREAFAARDYARAVDVGERFLAKHEDHAAARTFVQECRVIFEKRIAKELEPLDRVVVLSAPLDALAGRSIEPRIAFVLSRVDDATTIEDLVDLSGMSRVDALRTISECIARGLVTVR